MEFRLIVKSPLNSKCAPILLENKQWYLSEPLRIGVSNIPKFTAISYRWGTGRLPNPFYEGQEMSDQTYYALSAAINNSNCSAFWIDALCIPIAQPARSATLGAMGFIYSIAEEVIVSFPPSRAGILRELQRSDRLTDQALTELENDEWVSSIWTYDEVVNSGNLKFVSDGYMVEGQDFLNFVGYSLTQYGKSKNLNSFEIYEKLPHLDALTDLLADWYTATFTERSAFQVMANLDRRTCEYPAYYFYAMIASITDEIIPIEQAPAVESLSQIVMKICEEKNDFSFIFSTAERDERVGKEWRPIPGVLHSILPWHTTEFHGYDNSQTGHWSNGHFYLDAMVLLKPKPLEGPGKEFIISRLRDAKKSLASYQDYLLSSTFYSILGQIGFTGLSVAIPTAHGFFYPQTACFDQEEGFEILVSTQVRWPFGAPGLARVPRLRRMRYFPGVFIGDAFRMKEFASDVLVGRTEVL